MGEQEVDHTDRISPNKGESRQSRHYDLESALREYDAMRANECDHCAPPDESCEDCDPCLSGWCGDSACYRCNPWGYGR